MIITKYGESFFKFVFSDKTIAYNPISKNSNKKVAKFGSDIAISSLYHPDFNGYSEVSYKDKIPFVIKGAGEYEISDIFIKGFGTKQKFESIDYMLTSYSLLFDNINIALFAPITNADSFSDEAFDEFSKADIFFIPIGGGHTFSPTEAVKFIKQFSPKIIIPTFYSKSSDVEEFSKALGVEVENEEKLTIKQKDLPEDGKIRLIVLKID